MKWIECGKNSYYCDDVLNICSEFIKSISNSYRKTYNRNIKLDELERILEISIYNNYHEHIHDSRGKALYSAKLRTKKLYMDPQLYIGSVIAIKMTNGYYAYAAVSDIYQYDFTLLLVYGKVTSEISENIVDIISGNSIFRCIIDGKSIAEERWPIVGKMDIDVPDRPGDMARYEIEMANGTNFYADDSFEIAINGKLCDNRF